MSRYIPGRCPAFARAADGEIDATSPQGAKRMARQIEARWHNAGCPTVKAWVEMVAPQENAFPRPVIRSNLKNGMPPVTS